MPKLNKIILVLFIFIMCLVKVNASTMIGVVTDTEIGLKLRDSVNGTKVISVLDGTKLTILSTNEGSTTNCNVWYKVSYDSYENLYACGDWIKIEDSNSSTSDSGSVGNDTADSSSTYSNGDESYNSSNYSSPKSSDGTLMCYENYLPLPIKSGASYSTTTLGEANCGDELTIEGIIEISNSPEYWYKVKDKANNVTGYVLGYYVNTTKLSSTATSYYNNNSNGDTIASYQEKLQKAGFPSSYWPYLLELHARYPKWNFKVEKINLNFDEVVSEEALDGRNLLNYSSFGDGFLSNSSYYYDALNDKYIKSYEKGNYYNASKEAIAYYLDPRNYLNYKYIFAFESLEYNSSYSSSIVNSVVNTIATNTSFWKSLYSNNINNATNDIVNASISNNMSPIHIASRIRQEMNNVSLSDPRLGGTFTYNGSSVSGYYNFFNIKSTKGVSNNNTYAARAYESGWNTTYKGINGGASFLYNNYVSVNQDTLYYEKFDVSSTDGNYTHQYMQNLAVAAQESGIKYNGYVNANAVNTYFDSEITFTIPVYNNMPNYAVSSPKLGSQNNYLKDIKINGYSLSSFNYNIADYKIYLSDSATSIDIDATKINSKASVSGTGTIKLTSDEQTQKIIVTAENGKKREYSVTIIRTLSEPITVAEAMNNSGFKYNDSYLFGINIGTKVSTLLTNISNYNSTTNISITSKDGSVNNSTFKTGDIITVTGSDMTKKFTAVIYGDVNGDGSIDKLDYLAILRQYYGYTTYSGASKVASDVNRDGSIDKLDYLAVLRDYYGYSKISQ